MLVPQRAMSLSILDPGDEEFLFLFLESTGTVAASNGAACAGFRYSKYFAVQGVENCASQCTASAVLGRHVVSCQPNGERGQPSAGVLSIHLPRAHPPDA